MHAHALTLMPFSTNKQALAEAFDGCSRGGDEAQLWQHASALSERVGQSFASAPAVFLQAVAKLLGQGTYYVQNLDADDLEDLCERLQVRGSHNASVIVCLMPCFFL